MSIIIILADQYGVSLMALPRGNPGDPIHERLGEFYQRFGFEDSGNGAYHRYIEPT